LRRRYSDSKHVSIAEQVYHGHEVTIHFVVNDLFMCFHFGLAIKEICSCFQPGGLLSGGLGDVANPVIVTLSGIFRKTLAL